MRIMFRFLPVLCVSLIAGCGASSPGSDLDPSAGCPAEGWDAAVIWSSELAPESRIDFLRDDTVVATQPLRYQGLETLPDGAPFWSGSDAWLVANGNTTREATHLLRWSQADCSVQEFPVDEQVIWSVVADDDAFYTTNTVNAAAHVRRRTMDGELAAETSVEAAVLTSLALDGDRLLATGVIGEAGTEETVVITFDAATLTEQSRVIVGPASYPVSTVVHDGQLYLPAGSIEHADGSGEEVSSMQVLDVETGVARSVDLGALSPYQVVESGDDLIFAHTFLNPAYREMNDYGEVTVFSPASQEISRADLGPGLLQIAVDGDELLVLTQEDYGDGPTHLGRHGLPDLETRSRVEIQPPSGDEHYLAGILTGG